MQYTGIPRTPHGSAFMELDGLVRPSFPTSFVATAWSFPNPRKILHPPTSAASTARGDKKRQVQTDFMQAGLGL